MESFLRQTLLPLLIKVTLLLSHYIFSVAMLCWHGDDREGTKTLTPLSTPTPTHDHESWHGRMERLYIPYFPVAARTWRHFWFW